MKVAYLLALNLVENNPKVRHCFDLLELELLCSCMTNLLVIAILYSSVAELYSRDFFDVILYW